MAAVLPFLETEEFHFPEELAMEHAGLSGLGAKGKKKVEETAAQMIAASNVEMTKLLWTRAGLQQALAGETFQLALDGASTIVIKLSNKFSKYAVPWAGISTDVQKITLFSTNSKMRCPTWDLPAGAGNVGGACPGALPAQTTSIGTGGVYDPATGVLTPTGLAESKNSILVKRDDGSFGLRVTPDVTFDLHRSVCSYCYASGSEYLKASTQLAELVRFALVKTAMTKGNEAIRAALVEAILWQIPRLPYERDLGVGLGEDKGTTLNRMSRYPNVIRVHSSGDFYQTSYAAMWLEIAQRLYAQYGMKYRLWAPTRTQVLPEWREWWRQQSVPPNFSIRPSAYGLGDYAPEAPNLAKGTSVLTPDDSKASKGEKFDHQCGVYDLKKGNKTCVDALAPDGKRGCRACWVRPDLRINYVAH